MKKWKGLWGAALFLCALLCIIGTVVAADGTHSAHSVCGATHKDIGDHTGKCQDVTWAEWNGTTDIDYGDNNTAYVYLTDNATRSKSLTVTGGTLNLCLNGKTLNAEISVKDGATLNICDCRGGGEITNTSGGSTIYVKTASLNVYGGKISASNGYTILLENTKLKDGAAAIFHMYGGEVYNSYSGSWYDAAVGIDASGTGLYRVNIWGGEITAEKQAGIALWKASNAQLLIAGGTISGADYALKVLGNLRLMGSPTLRHTAAESFWTADIDITTTNVAETENNYIVVSDDFVPAGGTAVSVAKNSDATGSVLIAQSESGRSLSGKARYFVSAEEGYFVECDADGDLRLTACAITGQPMADNRYTVTANGNPLYQWWSTKRGAVPVTDEKVTEEDFFHSGWNEGYWSYHESSTDATTLTLKVFTLHMAEGDVLTIEERAEPGDFWIAGMTLTDVGGGSVAATRGSAREYIFTVSKGGDYTLEITAECMDDGDSHSPMFSLIATVTADVVGDALSGQNDKTLRQRHLENGKYICSVTWEGKTTFYSDVVEFSHNWNAGEVTAEPTCTATGRKTYTCTDCFATKTETVNALGHLPARHEAQSATCTAAGWYAYVTCTRSGCGYTTYAEIPALGHDYPTDIWQKDADGHWKKCSRCDATEPKLEHVWNDGDVIVEPTCTATGKKTYTCTDCFATKTEMLDTVAHDVVHHDAKAATCTEKGWYAYDTCNKCRYTTYAEIPALGHDYPADIWQKDADGHWKKCSRCDATEPKLEHVWNDGDVIVEPTCSTTGKKTYTCKDCFATKTETVNALGHLPARHEAQSATCTTAGWYAYVTCTRSGCGYTTYAEIPALGHDYPADIWQKDADGHWKKCSRCDATEPKLEHVWNDGDVIVEPTCSTTGKKTYTCKDCFATKTEMLDTVAHDVVHHDAKAATCTGKGWYAYDTCNKCRYTTYAEISALGHDKVSHDGKAATCTESGYQPYETCSRCDYTTYEAIGALGHDFTGSVWQKNDEQHWKKCSRCDATEPKLGHTWNEGEVTTPATCAAPGRKTYTCTDCFATKTETVNALGHLPARHEAQSATCTAAGWYAYVTCTRSGCGYTTYAEIPALGHDYPTDIWQKDADGHWKKCSRCDATEPKLEHVWNDGDVIVEPTCSATGRKTYTCTICFTTKTEMLDTVAHDVVHHDAKAATCTEKGWYAYDTCNKCRYTTYAEISALGHDEVSHDGKAATCTESGYQPYETCSRCDYTTYETIDALGHDTVSHAGKAATCTEDGYQPYETCSRCDFTTYKTVGALGHDIVSHAGKGATCTEDGARPYEACSRCDYTTYEKIPARGHDRIPHDAKAATCTEIGWGVYVTCNRCRYTTYREIAALGHDEIPHAGKGATCTEGGYQPYVTCSRCDYTTCKKVDALGHDFTGGTWQSDAAGHWKRCSRCEVAGEKENHTGGTATCQGGAVCDVCFGVYGERNPGRHIGGTEIRDMREATAEKAGYTGNRYCKGCHVKLSDGTGIPTLSDLSVDKKSDLASAADAMEKFWNDQSDALTDEQEKQLADSIRAVRSALESIKNVEEAVKKAEAMPASDKILPDDEAAMVAYETAKKAYDALSAEEKEMAGERTGNALDAMQKALTAYDVTYGNGNTWTENEKDDGLTFTVNGSHKKFADLIINGAVVNREYYDIGQGSTIITLKAPYLQSLPAGTYTLLVRYTDGSTDGEDTFTITKNGPANPSDPNVTDHPVPVVWIGVVIACVVIIFLLLLLLFRKRKQEKDREEQ